MPNPPDMRATSDQASSPDNPFQPDSPLVRRVVPSQNINARRNGLQPEILVLHYTGLQTLDASLRALQHPRGEVSCHYVIDEDGTIIQMVPERMRAWHAGVSHWRGEDDINSQSIGIEIQNPGHTPKAPNPDAPPEDGAQAEHTAPQFPAVQMQAIIKLARDIADRNAIASRNIVGHSDIAPGRKIDPGEGFDWAALYKENVGLWVPPVPLQPDDQGIGPDARAPLVPRMQTGLQTYGYGLEVSGVMDARTTTVLAAFQRHFRPARVDGRLDQSTWQTLCQLLSLAELPLPAETLGSPHTAASSLPLS